MISNPAETFRQFLLSPAQARKSGAALILGIAVLTLFAPVLFSSHLLVSTPDGDLANQFYAWRQFGFTELAKGHLALWNPYIYCGEPYFAGFQSALLYPPNWAFLFLPLVFALNFSITFHVFLAGLFTHLWFSSHRLAFLPALFGSFIFMFGGAFFAHVTPGHLTDLCTMAWIPLVFMSVEKILESPSFQNLFIGAGILSLQLLSGHAQYFLYTVLFAILYALALIRREPSRWARQAPALLGFFALAATLTAIQWMPALEASSDFGRDLSAEPADGGFFSMNPLGLVTLLAPDFFGGPSPHSLFVNSRIWWEITPFIGGAAFLFLLNALRQGGFSLNRIPLGLVLLAALLSFGSYTFLYPVLGSLPLFHDFRGSFKFLVLAQAFVALLSARGLQSWLSEEGWSNTFSKGAFSFSLFFLLAAGWAWWGSWSWKQECLSSCLPTALGFMVFGLLGWSRKLPAKITLALLGMLNLWAFAQSHLPAFNVQSYLAESESLQSALAPNLGDERLFWSAHNDRSMGLGFPDVWGDDPLAPKRLSAFITSSPEPSTGQSADTQFLNLTSAKAALTRLGFFIERKGDRFQVTPSPFPCFPRVFLVGGWLPAAGPSEALQAFNQPGFNPGKEAILEGTPDPLPQENGGNGRISLHNHNSDRIELTVETGKPQILVMTDGYGSGWKAVAYPDSSQALYKVLPADVFARAIPLSAGKHHFDLVYNPPGFIAGKWISLITILLYCAASAGWIWRKAGER